jgi:hypothetical protein
MSNQSENPFESYDYRNTEESRAHERALRDFDALSSDEKLESMKRVGILNEDCELTKRYGGDAPNPDDD